jgi:hypothetical protein
MGFFHHIPLAERNQLFEMIGQQLTADINSGSLLQQVRGLMPDIPYRVMASQRIDPFISGTTWV